MKKLILIFAAMAFLSCGNRNEESEIELGEYNTDTLENVLEIQKNDSAMTDSAVTDTTTVDSAQTDTATTTQKGM